MPRTCRLLFATLLLLSLLALPDQAHANQGNELDPAVRAAMETIQQKDLEKHLYFLASDAMQGRDTPSPELDEAAAYIARQWEEAGLEPGGTEEFMQPLAFPTRRLNQTGAGLILDLAGEPLELLCPEDTVQVAGGGKSVAEVEASGVVFVPDLSLSSGGDLDLAGRLIITLQPGLAPEGEDPSSQAARFRQFFSTPGGLSRIAARMRVAGLLVVCREGEVGHDHFVGMLASAGRTRLSSAARSSRPVFVSRHPELASVVSQALGTDTAQLFAGSFEPRVLEGTALVQVGASVAADVTASNVAAVLPGRDAELRNEYVIVSAHYDHIGVGPAVNGDTIRNGADDDGTGTVSLLALAQAFAELPEAPRRSILFLAFCGEEKGLLGSRRYVTEPLVPLEQTVANVNVEMIGRPDDIGPNRAWMTGFKHSDLPALMAEAAQAIDFEVYRHEQLDERLFRASDNYSFASKGIPAHSISAGSLHADYHQPSDEPDKIDYPNMTRTVRAIFLGVRHLAERDERPRWAPDSPLRPEGR